MSPKDPLGHCQCQACEHLGAQAVSALMAWPGKTCLGRGYEARGAGACTCGLCEAKNTQSTNVGVGGRLEINMHTLVGVQESVHLGKHWRMHGSVPPDATERRDGAGHLLLTRPSKDCRILAAGNRLLIAHC